MKLTALLAVFVAGMGLVVQAPLNARMKAAVGSPMAGIALVMALSLVVLLVLAAFSVGGRPRLAGVGGAPWWAWTGGLLGTVYLVISMLALPRLGAALVVVAAVCGQMLAALVLDTTGWLGVDRAPLTPIRIVGAVLLVLAVVLIQRPAQAGSGGDDRSTSAVGAKPHGGGHVV